MGGVKEMFRRISSGGSTPEPEPERSGPEGPRSGAGSEETSPTSTADLRAYRPSGQEKGSQSVTFWMRVENIHYPLLADDPGSHSIFEGAIQHAVASEAGDGILPHCVELKGRPLLLQAVIDVPNGVSATAVQGKLDASATLADTITVRINKSIPEPGELFTGPISISNISDCTVSTVFDGTWKRESNIYSIRGASIRFPSGGQAEIVVTSANTFSITHPSGISLAARLESTKHRLKWSNGSIWKYAADQEEGEVITAKPSLQQEEAMNMNMPAARPQSVQGTPVWPQQWGITRAQCRQLLRRLRADPTWSSHNNIYALVADYVVPKTSGTGIGYALIQNQGVPREVNVLVTYAWAQNAEEFLEAVVRSTTDLDVLFICSLSLYQAEDGAGPSIAEQLGAGSRESPFQRVLEQIEERRKQAGSCRKCRPLFTMLTVIPLLIAAALFFAPIMIWGCVPSHDMSRCSLRTLPELGAGWSHHIQWSWSRQYEIDWAQAPGWARTARTYGYAYVAALVVLSLLSRCLVSRCISYNGRLLVVPTRATYISNRLWCIAHILDARRLKVPVVFASSLAPIGYRSARRAECSGLCDERSIRKEIEAKEGGPQCYDKVNSYMRTLANDQLLKHWLTMSGRALVLVMVCIADLRVVLGEMHTWEGGAAILSLGLLGVFGGVFSGACFVLCAAKNADGLPNWLTVSACALLLQVAGAVILAVLVTSEVIAEASLGHWTGAIDLLSDDGNRHHRHELCGSKTCQRATAFLVSLAHAWLLSGVNLALLLLGGLCCPRFLRRRQGAAALIGAATLLVAAPAVVVLRSKYSIDDAPDYLVGEPGSVFPGHDYTLAIVVFYLIQTTARCAAPLGILWFTASRWGVRVGTGNPLKGAIAAVSSRGKKNAEVAPLHQRGDSDEENAVTTL